MCELIFKSRIPLTRTVVTWQFGRLLETKRVKHRTFPCLLTEAFCMNGGVEVSLKPIRL